MATNESQAAKKLLRYGSVFLSQAKVNREFLYFWILATLFDITVIEAIQPCYWILIAVMNLLIGLVAIGSVVHPIDRAFESVGLDFSKGYGSPNWIVRGKYPLKNESFRINAAGYDASDFEKHVAQLSSRLNQPIKSIRKPAATIPEIEVVLKRSSLPSSVLFGSFDMNELKQGEFFVGESEEKLEILSLPKMVHMLVAGQTGAGKTQFLKQFIATILVHTRSAYVTLIDMKGGIDFQAFNGVQNFNMVTNHFDATLVLDRCVELFEKRRDYLLKKNKTNWSELSLKELEQEEFLKGDPIGPVVIVVDELAELSKKATEKSAKSELQEKIATIARLARFTGIHLVLGTQRPDKSTIDMQSKDNLPTRVCFSVPSVTASTLVIGDMTASTLGGHSGRAVFQLSGNKIIQAPLIKNPEVEALMKAHKERLSQSGYQRSLVARNNRNHEKKTKAVFE